MTIQNLLWMGFLLVASVASLSASNSLPNPHDDTCWSSISALRACQIQATEQAQAHDRDCTSYPEYQCFDYYQPQSTPKAKAKQHSGDGVPKAQDANKKDGGL